MRPFEGFTVDVFFEEAFFHHQTQVVARAAPRAVGVLVDDMAQVIEAAWLLGTAVSKPFFACEPAFPSARGEP